MGANRSIARDQHGVGSLEALRAESEDVVTDARRVLAFFAAWRYFQPVAAEAGSRLYIFNETELERRLCEWWEFWERDPPPDSMAARQRPSELQALTAALRSQTQTLR